MIIEEDMYGITPNAKIPILPKAPPEKVSKIPKIYYAKGNYFETNRKLGVKHLIYPIPTEASLGLHLGLDISMQMRFGPDVEWVNDLEYTVDPNRINLFYDDIIKYLPDIRKEDLIPGYSGIRPKLKNQGEGTVSYTHLTLPTKRIV